jgi:hypothetical protein
MPKVANYQTSPVPEYAGNPLIEALPPILTEEDAGEEIGNFPPIPDAERQLPREVRLHCIDRIRSLVQPLPIHLELETTISSLLRSGYVGRNPMHPATMGHLYALSTGRRSAHDFVSTASTLSLVGLSGMGKTTALNAVLSLYDQTIEHHRYKGKEFIHTQITWLKLECPYDGSLSGLCHAFFKAVDRALGYEDRYSSRFRARGGIQEMIQRMEQLASTYFIGALFIDELQHLNRAKVGGQENMLNFFVNLINSIGIPVVFVGTNSMVKLFSDVLRNARRACGYGTHYFKQPEFNDQAWDVLVEAVWDYQWVQNPAPLTPEIKESLYEHTQGVTDFLAKLMILGQRFAIQSKLETLTPEVFQHVSETKMRLLQPALEILRSGDAEKMSKVEDLMPPDDLLNEMMSLREPSATINNLASIRAARMQRQMDATRAASTNAEPAQPLGKAAEPKGADSTAKAIASSGDVGAAIRQQRWLATDALEFSDAYCTATSA